MGKIARYLSHAQKGDKIFTNKEKNKRKMPIEKGKDIYGWTLIHYAANKGNLEMLEYLVKIGIDVNMALNR